MLNYLSVFKWFYLPINNKSSSNTTARSNIIIKSGFCLLHDLDPVWACHCCSKGWNYLSKPLDTGSSTTSRRDEHQQNDVCPTKSQFSLGIHPVWSESLLSIWRKLGSLATHLTHSEDADQTVWMRRLLWAHAILLVLYYCSSDLLYFITFCYALSFLSPSNKHIYTYTHPCTVSHMCMEKHLKENRAHACMHMQMHTDQDKDFEMLLNNKPPVLKWKH